MAQQLPAESAAGAPMPSRVPTLVVGLGASAGGIEAMREFFAQLHDPAGLAYVVILHLSPDYESHLAEVLQTVTPIPVTRVAAPTVMAAGHVYVVSPDEALHVSRGQLIPEPVTRPEQRRAPVDVFFRALAEGYGPAAVAVVLSGTGPDGSNGLKRIKEFGGLTMVQDPLEAAFKEMPNNSLATGLVDYVLPVAQMPARLVEYARRAARPPTAAAPADPVIGENGTDESAPAQERAAQQWREVLALLRARTGHDFSNYKPATIRRRVGRRMHVRGLASLVEYTDFMRGDPDEPRLLVQELLISVTNFFRDPAAFAALEQRFIPLLFHGRGSGDQVRVWSAGCATGEEAYSLAMLLAEYAGTLTEPPGVQVFATDLDERAIAVAREGLYRDADVVDVSPERLQRYFSREAGGYRVRRELREVVLFARHNVIKDPPFSHLDLMSCRNLLIYLNRSVQEQVIDIFHFALRPGGYLFLGTAEVADASPDRFVLVDKDAHLFESRALTARPALPLTFERIVAPAVAATPAPLPTDARLPTTPDRISPGELHLRLLEQYAAPSIVVNEEHTVLHVSPHAAQFLQVTGGEPTRDLLRLIHPDLRTELRTALHLAALERTPVSLPAPHLRFDGGERAINVLVKPVLREDAPTRGYFLLLFEDLQATADGTPPAAAAAPMRLTGVEVEAEHLAEELTRLKAQLRTTVEQYETHSEETRAANEELQAMNEELRSSSEELETSKEELQSVNEELTTVNQELKLKIEELGLANNDFQNLINSTDIGAIFLDRGMRVKLSTPRARDVFNLLPADAGRRLSDITSGLEDERLEGDVAQVLERLQTIEREVRTREGRWYMMRILPYRTADDRIDGVSLTFHDITLRHNAEMQVRAGEERLRLLIDSVVDYAIFTMTEDGTVDSWNAGAERMFGFAAAEIIGQKVAVLFTPEDRAIGAHTLELATARDTGRASDERWHLRRNGERFYCSGVTTRIGGGTGGFVKVARDLTERRQSEIALEAARSTLEEHVQQRTRDLQEEVARDSAARAHVTSLLRRVVTAQEEERARLSRDLHDQLGQQLTALRLTLERHRQSCEAAGAREDLGRALQLAEAIDGEVDFLAWELRPAALDDLGLTAALPRYVREWSTHHGIAAEVHASAAVAGHLSPAAETAVYRIAQEALNNVVKHAHASRVDVLLEQRDREVVLVIEDDGIGFEPSNLELIEKGIGLTSMRERAGLVGAALDVESTPGNGTTVFLRCPIAGPGAGAPA